MGAEDARLSHSRGFRSHPDPNLTKLVFNLMPRYFKNQRKLGELFSLRRQPFFKLSLGYHAGFYNYPVY